MPVDSSIPLSYKPSTPLMSPTDLLSLQDLSTRTQANRVTLQEKQMDLEKRNALNEMMKQPGFVGPDGLPTPQGITSAMQIDPNIGMGLAKDRISLQNIQMILNDKRTAVAREIGQGVLQTWHDKLQRGMDSRTAWSDAVRESSQNIDSQAGSGAYSGKLSPQDVENLKKFPPTPEEMMGKVRIMGGNIPEMDITPFAKELRAGGVLPGTPQYADAMRKKIAKDTAPTQTTLMMSGQLDIPEDTARFVAQQYLAGDRTAAQGFARNARARAQIATAIATEAKAQGMDAKDAASSIAEFEGMKAGERTLGTRQAQIEVAANVVKQFVPIAKDASEAFTRSGVKSLNDLQIAVQKRTASPELRRLNASVNAVVNAYARAVNPTGVGNESDKVHAREILDSGFSKGDFNAAADQLMVEINAELKAPGAVKGQMREFFTGKKPTGNTSNDWVERAMKANPNMSREEVEAEARKRGKL